MEGHMLDNGRWETMLSTSHSDEANSDETVPLVRARLPSCPLVRCARESRRGVSLVVAYTSIVRPAALLEAMLSRFAATRGNP